MTSSSYEDQYPTRLESEKPLFPRLDPIIHSRNQARWDGPLDEGDLSRFERDGYLWFRGFFSRERTEPFREEFRALAKDDALMRSPQVILDPETGDLRSVFALHELSERFRKLTRDPRILGIVRQILGGDAYLHQSRINEKHGFSGNGFDWHSDFETWHSEDGMPRMRAVSASVMLTDNNEFNGPLMLIRGSHQYFVPCVGATPEENWKQSLRRQLLGVPSRSNLQRLARAMSIEAPKGPAGSLLLFDCNTLHASNRNISPWPRSNLFFVYNSCENQLVDPFCGNAPRPAFLATRGPVEPLSIHDQFEPLESVPA